MIERLFRLLTELSSRKWVSKLAGRFAKSRLSRRFIPRFVKTYGIDWQEAEKPLNEYETLNEFFTRKLKREGRTVHADTSAVVSPVDGLITGMGNIESGRMLNIKGQDYTVEALLNGSPRTVNYMNGFYYVLYLSPKDYHRIHAPVTGKIIEKEYIPGKVYPVNDFGLRNMRAVLSRNERLVTYVQHEFGEISVVKVGALNVASIQYADANAKKLVRGGDLAYFEFGSTVVLLMENGTFEPAELRVGDKVRMGQALGALKSAKE
jgi:phosphatidylserine decarboxylase